MKKIPLSRGKYALVDDEDYNFLSQFNWHVQPGRKTDYATRGHYPVGEKGKGRVTVRMHREIMGLPMKGRDIVVDHINDNGLDNRRKNLRVCTARENRQNSTGRSKSSSKFKGVDWCPRDRCWRAYIKPKDQPRKFIGHLDSEIAAAKAYDKEALEHFGKYARENFI